MSGRLDGDPAQDDPLVLLQSLEDALAREDGASADGLARALHAAVCRQPGSAAVLAERVGAALAHAQQRLQGLAAQVSQVPRQRRALGAYAGRHY